MGKMKWRLALFTVPEYVKEQEWLSAQHKKGWKLVDTAIPCFYHFEQCEPEEVVYQLDYNQEGMKNKEDYVQMFQDCGWEHICDMTGFSYFRKPVSQMQRKEEIFSDAASKLELAKRVFKGRMLPLLAILLLVIFPQLSMLRERTLPLQDVLYGIYIGFLAVYIVIFIKYGVQYLLLKVKVGEQL